MNTNETSKPSRLKAAFAAWNKKEWNTGSAISAAFAEGYYAGYDQCRKDAEAAMAKALEAAQ